MLLAERAGRKLEPWSNSRPRGMAVIAGQPVVTESGLSACFTFQWLSAKCACMLRAFPFLRGAVPARLVSKSTVAGLSLLE